MVEGVAVWHPLLAELSIDFDKANEILLRLGIIYKQHRKCAKSLDCFERILCNPPNPLAHADIWFYIGHVSDVPFRISSTSCHAPSLVDRQWSTPVRWTPADRAWPACSDKALSASASPIRTGHSMSEREPGWDRRIPPEHLQWEREQRRGRQGSEYLAHQQSVYSRVPSPSRPTSLSTLVTRRAVPAGTRVMESRPAPLFPESTRSVPLPIREAPQKVHACRLNHCEGSPSRRIFLPRNRLLANAGSTMKRGERTPVLGWRLDGGAIAC
ncbi:hypothetical protein FOMPIDRAFT_114008 [Fomitopsis schrenkii]|uniref:TPR-like protein n=1 Tax=Fomitopsis schrenkii TaxID=2126942 RepID=S8F3Q9_FOMSC|nr:hypothetical protein FOMPIDRAFT_114008 [Fomitopsis schrenkii]